MGYLDIEIVVNVNGASPDQLARFYSINLYLK